MSYKAVFFQRWFETKPILQKKTKKVFYFFRKWQPFCFWKKTSKKTFFSNFKGPKIKNKSYLVFLKDLAELSLNIENGVTIMWSVKSVGLQNLPFLKFWKKFSQLWCPGNQCGQLSRSLKIWIGIVPYDGYIIVPYNLLIKWILMPEYGFKDQKAMFSWKVEKFVLSNKLNII